MKHKINSKAKERRHPDSIDAKQYLKGKKKFFHKGLEKTVVKVFAGEWYITDDEEEVLATILGSCVAACIRDPLAKVGGMNHFLLPGEDADINSTSEAARYGLFAMENLINALLKAGAHRDRLEFKIFGGGNVIKSSAKVGSKNATFVRNFLKTEGYRIAASDLEGNLPRSIHYYPISGKTMMRKLQRKEDYVVVEDERAFKQKISTQAVEGDIELFDD